MFEMEETYPVCPSPQVKTLHLPMVKKWFDMVLSGEKKEEYRLCSPHWNVRVENWMTSDKGCVSSGIFVRPTEQSLLEIKFVNGYQKESPWFTAMCERFETRSKSLHPEWGESEYDGENHFVFHVGPIVERRGC